MTESHRKSYFRRISNFLFVAIPIAIVTWLAITRWNGVPKDAQTPILVDILPTVPVDPQLDRSRELEGALEAFPPLPPLVLPNPPPGMQWSARTSEVDIGDAVNGDWILESRPNLAAVVQYLNFPGVEQALQRIASVPSGIFREEAIDRSLLRQAAELLAARTRFRVASKHDIDGGLQDIRTLFKLSSIGYRTRGILTFYVSLACEYGGYWELVRLCHENPITMEQFKRIATDLSEETLDQGEVWRCVVDGQCGIRERVLELTYTNDGRGDGWLVLSHLDSLAVPTWSKTERCGAWNMLSPLFNGRRAVSAKLMDYRRACESIGGLAFSEGSAAATRADAKILHFSVLDGPIAIASVGSLIEYSYQSMIRRTAMQRACLTSAALSAYRHAQGQYPSTLDALINEYLPAQSIDPYCNEPLRYRVLDKGRDFCLYAVGPNRIDDGGKKKAQDYDAPFDQRKEDVVFDHLRSKTNFEPKLEPLKK